MKNQHSICTEPKARGNLFERFMAGELGEWGRGQFMDHFGVCEFCQKKMMIHFLEPIASSLPPAEKAALQTAIKQWKQQLQSDENLV